jgi:hypothetical protein
MSRESQVMGLPFSRSNGFAKEICTSILRSTTKDEFCDGDKQGQSKS